MTLKKTKEIVVQSNRLIEAHYRLTLQEKRLILWLTKEIKRDDIDFKKYQLKITDFAEMMGLNPKTQYKEMRRITKALMSHIIEIEDPQDNSIKQMAWLCFAHWEPKKGICSLEFHPELKPYLLQLKVEFTQVEFSEVLGLKSVYSIRIFELLIQYLSIGKRKTSVNDLRSWCGIQKEEYKLYADLKRRVIDKAKEEINAKTEYEVDYKEIKESRRVASIEWIIKKKTHFEKMQDAKVIVLRKEYRSEAALIDRMVEYGFGKYLSQKLIQNHGEEAVTDALKAVDIQVERGVVRNPKAMVQTAIKERWHPEKYKDRKKRSN